MVAVVLRREKGTPLTSNEADNNFENLKDAVEAIQAVDPSGLAVRVTDLEESAVYFSSTKAAGNALAASLPDGATVIVEADESQSDFRVRYSVVSGVLAGGVVDDVGHASFTAATTGAVTRAAASKLSETVSASDFGILVNDDPTRTRDKFNSALQKLSDSGTGPKELLLLDTSNWYLINNPLIMRSGVSLIGPAGKYAKIKNNRSPYDFFGSSVILPGNFHPDFLEDITQDPISATTVGARVITLTNAGDAVKYPVGTQVVVQSTEHYLSSGFKIPRYIYLNEVVEVSGADITLRYAIDRAFSGGMIALDGTQLGRNSVPLFFWQNGRIENIEMSTIGYVHSDTATLNCDFKNVFYRGRAALYGNSFQRTRWKAISGAVGWLGEMSLCSLDCTVEDIDFSHDASLSAPTGSAFMGWQENSRNIRFRRGKVDTGSYSSGAPLLNFLNAEGCSTRDLDIVAGSGYTGAVVGFTGQVATGRLPCKDNAVDDIRATGSALARYYAIDGDNNVGAVVNNSLTNSEFYGAVSSGECGRITDVPGDRNVVRANHFEDGRPLFGANSSGMELVDNYINDGIAVAADPDVYTRHLIKGNRSSGTTVRQRACRNSTSLLTQTGTTTLTLIDADLDTTLMQRDNISFEIRGNITGTNSTKTVAVRLRNNTDSVDISLGSKVFAAGITGTFVISGSVYFALFNSIVFVMDVYTTSGTTREIVEATATTDITGKDISFQIDAVCANAGDGMTFRKFRSALENPMFY